MPIVQKHLAFALNDRDTIDLDTGVAGQPCCLDRCPRRFVVGKEPAIDLIHLNKIVHIRQKHRCLYNVVETRPRRFQYLPEVLKYLFSLLADHIGDELTRLRINRYLAGAKYHAPCLDRLRIGADGPRRTLCCYSFFHKRSML